MIGKMSRTNKTSKTAQMSIRDLSLCALFAGLMAVGAYIKIPAPLAPLTMQYFFAVTAGMLLGSKLGAISVLCYILLGFSGLPVFAEGGGIAYVLKPSFGYIIGFCAASWAAGKIVAKTDAPSFKRTFAACAAGLVIVYTLGAAYLWAVNKFYIGKDIGAKALLVYCFAIYIPGDMAQCALAGAAAKRLIPILRSG